MSRELLDSVPPPTTAGSPVPVPSAPIHDRIIGLDIARGLAVLGMFAAHLLISPTLNWADPSTWGALVNGNSAILFATLAGISIGIMTAGRARRSVSLLQARMRIVVRAGLILLIGAVLELLGTPVAVILGVYALLFLAMLPFVTWSARQLLALTVGSAVVGTGIFFFVIPQLQISMGTTTAVIVSGSYPGIIWFTFFAAGLALSRLDLRSRRTQSLLVLAGIGLAVVGYLGSALARDAFGTAEELGVGADAIVIEPVVPADIPDDSQCTKDQDGVVMCFPADLDGVASGVDEPFSADAAWQSLLVNEPHAGTPAEMIGSGGIAMAIIGLCLLLARVRVSRAILWPVAAIGSMALTAYSLHIVVMAFGESLYTPGTMGAWVAFAIGAAVFCSGWKAWWGKGPLERLLATVATRTTRLTEPPVTAVAEGADVPSRLAP